MCYSPRVDLPVIMAHDPGCRYAREANGGHSDAARRLSDLYNLHRLMTGNRGGIIAVRFSDGQSDGTIYPDRETAMRYQHHNERWYCYVDIGAAVAMTVCEAAAVLRFQAHAAKLAPAERDAKPGSTLEVIPRLTIADRERQIGAMQGRVPLPVALGRRKRR